MLSEKVGEVQVIVWYSRQTGLKTGKSSSTKGRKAMFLHYEI